MTGHGQVIHDRSLLASGTQWMYVTHVEHLGCEFVCEGLVGDPEVPMSEWVKRVVAISDDNVPEVKASPTWVDDQAINGNEAP